MVVPSCHQDYLTCDMVSLFELGSVHHSRYLVNLRLHFMPLANHVTEFRGLSQLSEVMVLVSVGREGVSVGREGV